MDRMDDLEAFIAIVEQGSQTAAARGLSRSLQSINRSLATLERGLGISLIRRTTRRSAPTQAGLAFYRKVKPALAQISEARRDAGGARSEPAGLLRVGAPVLFAAAHVTPAACDVMARHPSVEIELRTSDAPVDLLEHNLDLAVRIRELPDSTMKSRQLGELRVVVFGAPAYFAEHGRPRHPRELARHQCVVRATDTDAAAWPFRLGGRRRSVRVHGRLRSDGGAVAQVAAARGLGIARAPLWQIRSLVDSGAVEVILEEFEVPALPTYAVWPASKSPSAVTRLFADALAARLKQERL